MTAKKKKTPNVLAIDIGGSHVKVMTSRERVKRQFVSGPKLSARQMVAGVRQLTSDWTFDAITIGYPGVVSRDRIVKEPVNLGRGWVGFDFAKAFGKPTRVVNDAVMQALGSYEGGRMLFLGLGTGLGSAMIIDGELAPMELGHLPYQRGKSFEHYVGSAGLKRLGRKTWHKHVVDVVGRLAAALQPDYIVLGGGNVSKLAKLPPLTRRGANRDAFAGGFKLWDRAGKPPLRPGNRRGLR